MFFITNTDKAEKRWKWKWYFSKALLSDGKTQQSIERGARAFSFASFPSTVSVGVLTPPNIYDFTVILRAQSSTICFSRKQRAKPFSFELLIVARNVISCAIQRLFKCVEATNTKVFIWISKIRREWWLKVHFIKGSTEGTMQGWNLL